MNKKVASILFNYADRSGMNEYKMWLIVGEENWLGKVESIEECLYFPAEFCTETNYLVRFEGGKSMRVTRVDIVNYSENYA